MIKRIVIVALFCLSFPARTDDGERFNEISCGPGDGVMETVDKFLAVCTVSFSVSSISCRPYVWNLRIFPFDIYFLNLIILTNCSELTDFYSRFCILSLVQMKMKRNSEDETIV